MSKRSKRMEITSTDLLDSVRCSFEIAVSALVQAGVNLGTLGLEPTKLEVRAVVEDLRKAITAIDNYKSNSLFGADDELIQQAHEVVWAMKHARIERDLAKALVLAERYIVASINGDRMQKWNEDIDLAWVISTSNPAVTVPPLVADKVDELVGRPNSESEGT